MLWITDISQFRYNSSQGHTAGVRFMSCQEKVQTAVVFSYAKDVIPQATVGLCESASFGSSTGKLKKLYRNFSQCVLGRCD